MEIDDEDIELMREIRDKTKAYIDYCVSQGFDEMAAMLNDIKRKLIQKVISTATSKAIQKLDLEFEEVS